MKLHALAFATLTLALPCPAQDQKSEQAPPKTKLQAFDALAGAVIIKGYSKIGAVAGMGQVSIDAKEFTNASSGRSEYGITIQVKEAGRLEREDTSFIDYEEIDSLLAGIDYVKAIKRFFRFSSGKGVEAKWVEDRVYRKRRGCECGNWRSCGSRERRLLRLGYAS